MLELMGVTYEERAQLAENKVFRLDAELRAANELLTRALDWMPAHSPVRQQIIERIKRQCQEANPQWSETSS
jgi:hypothetical protein